ncbi:MAG: hypothetical protein ACE3JP_05500 [Ectobacillus sp.]
MKKSRKIMLLIWLIGSEIILALTLFWWYIGWVFASEMGALFFSFISTYPIFVVISAIMSWRAFVKEKYQKAIRWSLFPAVWYLLLVIILLVDMLRNM